MKTLRRALATSHEGTTSWGKPPPEPEFTAEQERRADAALRAVDLAVFMGWDDDRVVAYGKETLRPQPLPGVADRVIVLP